MTCQKLAQEIWQCLVHSSLENTWWCWSLRVIRVSPSAKQYDVKYVFSARNCSWTCLPGDSQCWAQKLEVRKLKAKVDLGDSQCSPLNTKRNYVSASSVQTSSDARGERGEEGHGRGRPPSSMLKLCLHRALTSKAVKDMRGKMRNAKCPLSRTWKSSKDISCCRWLPHPTFSIPNQEQTFAHFNLQPSYLPCWVKSCPF